MLEDMIFRYQMTDGEIAGITLEGRPFVQSCRFDMKLIEDADPSFLSLDGDTLTIRVVEATATYRVERHGPWLDAELVSVESAEVVSV